MQLKTPDITPTQIGVVIGQVIAVVVAFGVHLTPDQEKAVLALAVTVGAILLYVDKEIRGNRAKYLSGNQPPPAE